MVGDTKEECYDRGKHVHGYTKRERERQINIQYVTRYTSITQRVFLLTSLMQKKIISNRISAQNNEPLRADGARTQHTLNEDND